MNYKRKPSTTPNEVILIEEEEDDDFAKQQRALLDQKGQMLYMRVKDQYPQWDEVEVQMYIIEV